MQSIVELPILITADSPVDTNPATVGQLIADAVTVATPPMKAIVALTGDTVDPPQDPQLLADLDVIDPGGRHTREPRRLLAFVVTLYADPDTIPADPTDLISAAHQAIAVQLDAAHEQTITSAVVPLDHDQHQQALGRARTSFRTGLPQN